MLLKLLVSLDRRRKWGKRTVALLGLPSTKARRDAMDVVSPIGADECSSYFFCPGKAEVLTGETWCFVSLVAAGLTLWANGSATPMSFLW